MDTAVSLGAWVRRRRKALDLTQRQLAALVGCSTNLIAKIEGDARRPSRQVAERLARHLELPPAERERFVHAARAALAPDRLPAAGDVALPPLAQEAPTRPRHNLPAQLTPLIGRAREVAELSELLSRPDTRLVTLTGPGGVGKTRLALAAAEALLADPAPLLEGGADAGGAVFPDGAWLVDLAPLADPAQVPAAIGRALGVPDQAGRTPVESLRAALHASRLLLVLDGFERLLHAAPLVSDLLHAAPGLAVLATSRAPLHLAGERAWEVAPLEVAQAAELFVERAQAARKSFALTDANMAAVAAICRRLDGLPLAVELAAARARVFAPAELLARLEAEGGLALLGGGPRDAPARQRTVRATIEWSERLLPPGERALLRRLGVFAGGFSLAAASNVGRLGGASPLRKHDLRGPQAPALPRVSADDGSALEALVDHSMVQRLPSVAGEARFALLATVREFALEQLAARGELAAAQRRHAEHVLALCESAAPQLLGPAQGLWRERLAADHANLSAALAWSLAPGGEPEAGLRIAASLLWYWKPLGYRREALAWLDALLAACPDAPADVRAHALHAAGLLAARQGQYARGQALVEAALALCRAAGDAAGIAGNLTWLSALAREQGHYDRAQALADEALACARASGPDGAVMGALQELGHVALERGDADAAPGWYQLALPLARALGDAQTAGWIQANLGRAALLRGEVGRAAGLLAAGRAVFADAGLRDGICFTQIELGRAALAQGDADGATETLAESLRLALQLWMPQAIALAFEGLAGVACARGCDELAARLLGAAEAARAYGSAVPTALDRAEAGRTAKEARAALGDAAFEESFAAGRALTAEQAAAEALA